MSRTNPPLPEDPTPCPLPTATSTRSFWHSEPSPLLTAHRSTRNLPQKADVVIIGSGMTGTSVAHHLLSEDGTIGDGHVDMGDRREEKGEGLSVVMLEAREACWGATGRNGGHCQPLLLEHPSDPSIPAFELANFEALQFLITNRSIPCEFVAQPGVRAMYSVSNLHTMELALHTLQSTAPDMAKLTRITRDEAELEALRVPGAVGAVVTDVAARMWPYKFVARILEDLLTASELPGGEFNLQTLTPVTGLNRSSGGYGWEVQTERGSIIAAKVVLATNAYTSHLLPSLSDLIVPVRGQMSALRPLPSVSGSNRLQTSFGFAGDGIDDYLIQRPNESGGHLMFGGGRQCKPCVGEADDSSLNLETAEYLRRRLVDALDLPEKEDEERERRRRMTPIPVCEYCRVRRIRCSGPPRPDLKVSDTKCTNCLRFQQPCGPFATVMPSRKRPLPRVEFDASHEWTGIMGFSRDDLPWVGQVPTSLLSSDEKDGEEGTGLFIAAGYTGHGMPNTWLCGAAVARMMTHPEAAISKDPEVTGVPKAYLVSEERVARAKEVEGVHARDWAEMETGRRRDERPASGYA